MPLETDPLLSAADAAQLLDITRQRVTQLVSAGKISAVHYPEVNRFMIRRSEIERFRAQPKINGRPKKEATP